MHSAEEFAPERLVGKRVVFKTDEAHAACWHQQVGLAAGVVVRLGQSLAQKAALLAAEGIELPESLIAEPEPQRLWVKVDVCETMPRGCEAAVEAGCLLVEGP